MNAAGTSASPHSRSGFALGLSAYFLWGVLPLYFKAVSAVPPFDIVAHRVLWSLPVLAGLIIVSSGWQKVGDVVASRRTFAVLALTSVLIAGNWLLYVWAVNFGHLLAASFGYYLNPLANVLLGRFALKEKLSPLQWTAVGISAAGISVLAAGALSQLWISLTLCISFSLYGLLRKVVPADAVTGLAVETAILFPVAIAWLAWRYSLGQPVMGAGIEITGLLVLAGIVSTTPLLLFNAAAKHLPYSTMGMLQFIAPTLQFLIAVLLYGERLTTAHIIAFGSIWIALALYVTALIRAPRLPQPPE
jgi:chloramphenicol-sensitive protein RarD